MTSETHVGFGAIRFLKEALARYRAQSVFLVTGGASFSLSGAEEKLKPLLMDCKVDRFFEFSGNPNLQDVESGIDRFRKTNGDVVVAVGGGSAIDMAKLINVYAAAGVPGGVVEGKPLIAIPTTAGTGSEATQFATLYIDKTKHSVAGAALLPNVAIVDPGLTRTLPPFATAATGMDALTQAIESFWCVNSTEESKRYAKEAIRLIAAQIRNAVQAPADESRLAMAQGAHLAGQAINMTRTTAPHALSYALTSRFGVPHGQAVSLMLPLFLVFNYGVHEEDAADRRGAAYSRLALEEISDLLGYSTVAESSAGVRKLMKEIGLSTTFAELGIDKQAAIEVVIREVNAERLVNNPRRVTEKQLLELLATL